MLSPARARVLARVLREPEGEAARTLVRAALPLAVLGGALEVARAVVDLAVGVEVVAAGDGVDGELGAVLVDRVVEAVGARRVARRPAPPRRPRPMFILTPS